MTNDKPTMYQGEGDIFISSIKTEKNHLVALSIRGRFFSGENSNAGLVKVAFKVTKLDSKFEGVST